MIEPDLIAKWGGWPTTVLLRHRDLVIDPNTKLRYHAALTALCDGLALPSKAVEEEAREDSDRIYSSAIKRLIERRRGPEFGILHAENASYGFRRNMLGMKPFGIAIAISAIIIAIVAWLYLAHPTRLDFTELANGIASNWLLSTFVALDVMYIGVWCLIVREPFVYQAAREYAEALLKTLEQG
jgi:hypothetical protein